MGILGLIIFLIVYAIASVGDSIRYENDRRDAIRKGYNLYCGKGGMRYVDSNKPLDYNYEYNKLKMSMYENVYNKCYPHDAWFRKKYPTLQDYIKAEEEKRKIG